MKGYRKKLAALSFLSIAGITAGFLVFILEIYKYDDVAFPLIWGLLPLLLISFLLLFLREAIFRSWGIFALWFIPLSVVLIASSSSGGGGLIFGSGSLFDIEGTTLFMSGTFLFISLLIIIYKSWKSWWNRKENETEKTLFNE